MPAPLQTLVVRVRRRFRAFSLLELMVTLGMVALLSGLVATSLSNAKRRSMMRQSIEVARGSLYEWRDTSRNAHMIGCISSNRIGGTSDYDVKFQLIQANNCQTFDPANDVVQSDTFKLVGITQLKTLHKDSSGNVLFSDQYGWTGGITVDGTPGALTGDIEGVQLAAHYEASQEVEGTAGSQETGTMSSGTKMIHSASGQITIETSQSG